MSGARPTSERFREVFDTLEPYVERRFGIPVVIRDVPSPFTGDLDGAEIHVDYDQDAEAALFILAHLFGHTVQWNVSAEAREHGRRFYKDPTDEQLRWVERYETQACRYSMRLFHDAGVRDLDQWLSDFAACDYAYLVHFYKTGATRDFRTFWRPDQPLLEPLAVPDFHPTKWVARATGVVV